MSVKPILMNTEMVRAILDGRKTVTRRAVKCTHKNAAGFDIVRNHDGKIVGVLDYDEDERSFDNYTVPPYKPVDILWVRETWTNHGSGYYYRADADERGGGAYYLEHRAGMTYESGVRWRPSIHMPREAARIFLRVTDVRVERLQEIDGNGLRAEGFDIPCLPNEVEDQFDKYGATFDLVHAKRSFSALWDSTIKPADRERYGWAASPWVWVIEFERCEKPEEV